eukprot:gene2925-3365_t
MMENLLTKLKEKSLIHRTNQSLNIIDSNPLGQKHFNELNLELTNNNNINNSSIRDKSKTSYESNANKRKSLPASFHNSAAVALSLQQQHQQQTNGGLLQVPVQNLSNKIDLSAIRDDNRLSLANVLKKTLAGYALVIDPSITSLLNLTADVSFLKRVLEEEGVVGDITALEYPLYGIPFDSDVVSLETPAVSFADILLDHGRTSLASVVKSLVRLQLKFGIIQHIKGKGTQSRLVVDALIRARKDIELAEDIPTISTIDSMIIMDREVDLVTPLCTPLTYEGLIDEFFSINNNNNFSKLVGPGGVLNKKARGFDDAKLNGSESLAAIRDLMKRINASHQDQHALRVHISVAEKIQDITTDKFFKNRLEAEQKLLHGVDVESVEEYIENCMEQREPLLKVLRLVALYSMTTGGVAPMRYDIWKSQMIKVYGCSLMLTLNNLEKIGMVRVQAETTLKNAPISPFHWMSNELDLIVEDIDEADPRDFAYVYSGYAPLSVRLLQHCFRPKEGWRSIEAIMNKLPGPMFEETQPPITRDGATPPCSSPSMSSTPARPKTLVYYIGGITFSEISAIRFLGHFSLLDIRDYQLKSQHPCFPYSSQLRSLHFQGNMDADDTFASLRLLDLQHTFGHLESFTGDQIHAIGAIMTNTSCAKTLRHLDVAIDLEQSQDFHCSLVRRFAIECPQLEGLIIRLYSCFLYSSEVKCPAKFLRSLFPPAGFPMLKLLKISTSSGVTFQHRPDKSLASKHARSESVLDYQLKSQNPCFPYSSQLRSLHFQGNMDTLKSQRLLDLQHIFGHLESFTGNKIQAIGVIMTYTSCAKTLKHLDVAIDLEQSQDCDIIRRFALECPQLESLSIRPYSDIRPATGVKCPPKFLRSLFPPDGFPMLKSLKISNSTGVTFQHRPDKSYGPALARLQTLGGPPAIIYTALQSGVRACQIREYTVFGDPHVGFHQSLILYITSHPLKRLGLSYSQGMLSTPFLWSQLLTRFYLQTPYIDCLETNISHDRMVPVTRELKQLVILFTTKQFQPGDDPQHTYGFQVDNVDHNNQIYQSLNNVANLVVRVDNVNHHIWEIIKSYKRSTIMLMVDSRTLDSLCNLILAREPGTQISKHTSETNKVDRLEIIMNGTMIPVIVKKSGDYSLGWNK